MEFVCSVWISEITANLALQNIKRLVFITEVECLQRGADRVLIYQIHFVFKRVTCGLVHALFLSLVVYFIIFQ